MRWFPVSLLCWCLGAAPSLAASASIAPSADGVDSRPLAWELIHAEVPPSVLRHLQIPLELRNVGAEAWDPEMGDAVSYHWLDASGDTVVWDGERTALPRRVEPGERVSLELKVQAPSSAGAHRLVVEPLREHVAWFGPPVGAVSDHPVQVESLGWRLVRGGRPWVLISDADSVRVTVENAGTTTWRPDDYDRLAYHLMDGEGRVVLFDGARTNLEGPVAPGEQVTLEAAFFAPRLRQPFQRLTLEWEMVRDEFAWYGPPVAGKPVQVAVWVVNVPLLLKWGVVLLGLLGSMTVLVLQRLRRRSHLAVWAPVVATWAVLAYAGLQVNRLADLDLTSLPVLLVLSGAALCTLPTAVAPVRWRPLLAAGTAVAGTGLAFADVAYLRYFGSFLPIEALAGGHQVSAVGDSIAHILHFKDAVLLIPLSAGLLLSGFLASARLPWDGPGAQRLTVSVIAFTALTAVPATMEFGRALGDERYTDLVFSERELIERTGFFQSHLLNGARAIRERMQRGSLSPERLESVARFYQARHEARLKQTTPLHGIARGRSVVLLQAEALQAYVIGARLDGQEVTPFLNRLARTSLYFPNVYDQSNQGRTSDAEFAVLNSQHAMVRGAVAFRRPTNGLLALPELLRRKGYTTLSAHANKPDFWNRTLLHPRYGFDQMVFRAELGEGRMGDWGLLDADFLQRVGDRMLELPRPFLAFPITVSTHHPFVSVAEEDRLLELGDWEGTLPGGYLQTVHSLDRSLERLFAQVEAAGLAEELLFVIYGDHDAGLDDTHQIASLTRTSPDNPLSALMLDRIPLIIAAPGLELGRVVQTPGGHIDIGPTVLDLLGLQAPSCYAGTSLLGAEDKVVAHPAGAFVSRTHAMVGGRCFDVVTRRELPESACESVTRAGTEELGASRDWVHHDLMRRLGCEAPSALSEPPR